MRVATAIVWGAIASGFAAPTTARQSVRVDLVISRVRVVHGDGRTTPDATVTVAGGRIVAVGREGGPGSQNAAVHVDGTGKTLIPGLIDAHVHLEDWTLPLFLKYGVTTVRDLHNDPSYVFSLPADAFDRPRIISAGALLDEPPSFWKNALSITTPTEARAAVRRNIDAGARVVKGYSRLQPALMCALVAEARARGVPVAAHLGMTNALEAADCGVTSIEHLSGIADAASADPGKLRNAHRDFLGGWTAFEREWRALDPVRVERVARQLIDQRVTIVPTLALHEAFSRLADKDLQQDPALADVPDRVRRVAWDPADIMGRARWTPAVLAEFKQTFPLLQSFVSTYARLGGTIAAGTDTAQQYVVPGASLHREIELYANSGLSPAAALKAATTDAAALLGISDMVGTIDVGKTADLVLLDADPIRDIKATRKIWKVIRKGVVAWERAGS